MAEDLPRREAARVVLVGDDGRALLFRYENPDDGAYWTTPGGGLEPGESHLDAARREVVEEVGRPVAEPLLPLREWTYEFTYRGARVRQHEVVYGARLAAGEPADVAAAHAADSILEARWWSCAELDATTETVWPDGLAGLVRAVRARLGF